MHALGGQGHGRRRRASAAPSRSRSAICIGTRSSDARRWARTRRSRFRCSWRATSRCAKRYELRGEGWWFHQPVRARTAACRWPCCWRSPTPRRTISAATCRRGPCGSTSPTRAARAAGRRGRPPPDGGRRDRVAALGQAADVVATRIQTDWKQGVGRAVPGRERLGGDPAQSEETPVTVAVRDQVSGDWQIVESDPAARKEDAQTLAFDVPVPAGGEAVLRYRVRIGRVMRPLLLVDYSSLLYRAFHSLPDSVPMHGVYGFLNMLARLVTDRRPDGLGIAVDDDWRPGVPRRRPALVQGAPRRRSDEEADPVAPQEALGREVLDGARRRGRRRRRLRGRGRDRDARGARAASRSRSSPAIATCSRSCATRDVTVLYPLRGVSELLVVDEAEITRRYGIPGRALPRLRAPARRPVRRPAGRPGHRREDRGAARRALRLARRDPRRARPAARRSRARLDAARDYLAAARRVVPPSATCRCPRRARPSRGSEADPRVLARSSAEHGSTGPVRRLEQALRLARLGAGEGRPETTYLGRAVGRMKKTLAHRRGTRLAGGRGRAKPAPPPTRTPLAIGPRISSRRPIQRMSRLRASVADPSRARPRNHRDARERPCTQTSTPRSGLRPPPQAGSVVLAARVDTCRCLSRRGRVGLPRPPRARHRQATFADAFQDRARPLPSCEAWSVPGSAARSDGSTRIPRRLSWSIARSGRRTATSRCWPKSWASATRPGRVAPLAWIVLAGVLLRSRVARH